MGRPLIVYSGIAAPSLSPARDDSLATPKSAPATLTGKASKEAQGRLPPGPRSRLRLRGRPYSRTSPAALAELPIWFFYWGLTIVAITLDLLSLSTPSVTHCWSFAKGSHDAIAAANTEYETSRKVQQHRAAKITAAPRCVLLLLCRSPQCKNPLCEHHHIGNASC